METEIDRDEDPQLHDLGVGEVFFDSRVEIRPDARGVKLELLGEAEGPALALAEPGVLLKVVRRVMSPSVRPIRFAKADRTFPQYVHET